MTERADAAAIADAYSSLSDKGRVRFFRLLAREFWTDAARSTMRSRCGNAAVGGAARVEAERTLRDALTPPDGAAAALVHRLDDGVKFLVDLRADKLRLAGDPRSTTDDAAALDRARPRAEGAARRRCSTSGCSTLRRITWDAPGRAAREADRVRGGARDRVVGRPEEPARLRPALLRVLPPGDARRAARVRRDRADDGHRRASSRRCSTRARPTLDPDHADTAVFYSISNCQPGLAGVNLGTALIKQVVEQLRHDLPQLHRFVTLSPIPGFRAWLDATLHDDDLPAARARAAARGTRARRSPGSPTTNGTPTRRSSPRWSRCARATSRPTRDGRALDPVANFHSRTARSIERINWLADPSRSGRGARPALMANYLYEPDRIAERAERVRGARRGRDARARVRGAARESTGTRFAARWRSCLPRLGPAVARRATTCARSCIDDIAPQLLALRARAACRSTSTTTRPHVPSMVPVPDDELPVRALRVDLGRRPRHREPVRGDARRRSASAAPGYLVTESLYRDYGDNEHAAPRDWPDGQRSPGIITLTRVRQARRRERRDVLRPLVRPPVADVGVDAAARPLRAQRGGARAHAGRAAIPRDRRGGVADGRAPSPISRRSSAPTDSDELGERIRIMLDSTKLLYDPATMRNYTLSEYILKALP